MVGSACVFALGLTTVPRNCSDSKDPLSRKKLYQVCSDRLRSSVTRNGDNGNNSRTSGDHLRHRLARPGVRRFLPTHTRQSW